MQKKKLVQNATLSPYLHRRKTFARIEVIKGPHKGVSYKLVEAKISIGRGKTNDLVLDQDEKCSRQQVVINFHKNHYSIKDISKRSSLKVNEKPQARSLLQDGDIIEFGHTILRFSFNSPSSSQTSKRTSLSSNKKNSSSPLRLKKTNLVYNAPFLPINSSHKKPPSSYISSNHNNVPPYQRESRRHFKKQKPFSKNTRLIITLFFIGSATLYLSIQKNTPQEQTDETDKLKTFQEIEEDIKTLEGLKKEVKEQHDDTKTSDFINSQFAYIRGIRDFRKGVYTRAIEAFKTCKTIDPQHKLCSSYLEKTKTKQQQLIQAWMIAGKTYREKRQFTSCISAFKNVMITINNPHNLTHKEAKENYDICYYHHLKGKH